MKRNRPEPLSKATSANDTSNQAVASGSSTSSGSSSSVVGAEDIQRLTNKNNSPNKGFSLAGQLYHPDITYHEQLLLTEQGADRQEQLQEAEPTQTRPQTEPNRYSFAKLTTFFNRGSIIVGKGTSSGAGDDQMDGGEELLKQESVKASSRKVMKMSRHSNKNNDDKNGRHTLNGGAPANGGDDLESDSKSGASSKFCTTSKCLLALLMGLVLIAATVYILIISFKTTDDRPCVPKYSPFLPLNNKLFATKTLYATTLNFLTHEPLYSTDNSNPVLLSYYAPPTPSPKMNDTPPTILQTSTNVNYATTSINKPSDIFPTQQSLRTVHNQLIRMGCFHDQFHFYGRHAARLPNEEGIRKIAMTIEDIKKRLYAPTLQTSAPQNEAIAPDQTTFTTLTPKPVSPHHRVEGGNKSLDECSDTMLELRQWNFFARPEQGNQLMETGGQEASSMAARFKEIFPAMFDGNKTEIKFGTTSATRTAQTAVHFLQKMDNFKSPVAGCSINDFPTEGNSDGDPLKSTRCLEKFTEQTAKPSLSFHEQCESFAGNNVSLLDHKLKLKDPHRTRKIVESVSKQLKWAKKNDKLTNDEVKAMYDVCRYESALKRTMSIWCRFFSDQDLKFYEYLSDVQDFFESAYGHPDQANSACPVTASLHHAIRTYVSSRTKLRFRRLDNYVPTANFYFTHSEVLQRLIAALIDLKADQQYQTDNILHHLRQGTVPKDRQWQTSLLTPFSANLAFNLYECPEQTTTATPGSIAFDVGNGTSPFKIVASLNEQPIKLGGCPSYICDYEHLREGSELVKHIPDRLSDTCDLKQFCKTKYVLT